MMHKLRSCRGGPWQDHACLHLAVGSGLVSNMHLDVSEQPRANGMTSSIHCYNCAVYSFLQCSQAEVVQASHARAKAANGAVCPHERATLTALGVLMPIFCSHILMMEFAVPWIEKAGNAGTAGKMCTHLVTCVTHARG